MHIFRKNPKFIIVECQKCGGKMEIDTNFETAHCLECNYQYIVQNVDKKKRQQLTKFDRVMDYVEKSRDLYRKDKFQKSKIKAEREEIEKKHAKRISIIIGVVFVVFIITMIILATLGIIE